MKFGVRDLVPVLLLLVALVIAFNFLDPSKGSSDGGHPTISLGEPPPTPTPAATPSPTEVPVAEVPAPSTWVVMFVSISPAGSETVDARYAFNMLDFEFEGPPFPDMRDNAWKLVVQGTVTISEGGRHAFTFEHDGEARVFVDGREEAFQADAAQPRTLSAVFDHPAGDAVIRVEVRDTGGALVLKSETVR